MITPVMPTYGRWDVAVDHGEGCRLVAVDGREFLDFTSGIGVTGLGHCHPHLVAAVTEQAKRLWHVSNMFHIPGQERLAHRLVDHSFADTVFFGNSGAEACELALKVARKYQSETGHPDAAGKVEKLASVGRPQIEALAPVDGDIPPAISRHYS